MAKHQISEKLKRIHKAIGAAEKWHDEDEIIAEPVDFTYTREENPDGFSGMK